MKRCIVVSVFLAMMFQSYAYEWISIGRTMGYGTPTNEPTHRTYTCAMWGDGVQVKVKNLCNASSNVTPTSFISWVVRAEQEELPSLVKMVPFAEDAVPWVDAPTYSYGPVKVGTSIYFIDNEEFPLLSLYRMQTIPYETSSILRLTVASDEVAGPLAMDAWFFHYLEYMNTIYPYLAEEFENAEYFEHWGYKSFVLPETLLHIADSASVGVFCVEKPVVLPSKVEYVGDMAFYSGDVEVDMSRAESLNQLGVKSLYGTRTKEVILSDKFEKIGELAFGPGLETLQNWSFTGSCSSYYRPNHPEHPGEYVEFKREHIMDVSYQSTLMLERVVSKNPVPPTVVMECKRDDEGNLTNEFVRDEPILCHDNVYAQIPLYVPDGSIDAYRNAPGWKKFTHIRPLSEWETSGIVGVDSDSEVREVARYTLSGVRVNSDYHGMVVVKYSDGTARKEFSTASSSPVD